MTWSNPKSLPVKLSELKDRVLLGNTFKSMNSTEVQWLMCDKVSSGRALTDLKKYSSGSRIYPPAWGQCGTKSTAKNGYSYAEFTDGKGSFRHSPATNDTVGSGVKWQISAESGSSDNAAGAMYVSSQFYADTDCGTLLLRYRVNAVSGNTNGGSGGVIAWRIYVYAFDAGFNTGASDVIVNLSGTSADGRDQTQSFTVPSDKRYIQVSAVAWMNGTNGSGTSLTQKSAWAFRNMQVSHI